MPVSRRMNSRSTASARNGRCSTSDTMVIVVVSFMKRLLNHSLRFCCLLLLLQPGFAQQVSFHITPLRPVQELRAEALQAQPPREQGNFRKPDLVELVKLDPTIKLDIRYATTNNFLGTPVYTQARAFLQRPAAEALVRANRELKAQGYGLIIHDGYRPWYVTKIFWDATPDDKKIFVANPATGSNHNRGCAVDLSLYDLKRADDHRCILASICVVVLLSYVCSLTAPNQPDSCSCPHHHHHH